MGGWAGTERDAEVQTAEQPQGVGLSTGLGASGVKTRDGAGGVKCVRDLASGYGALHLN